MRATEATALVLVMLLGSMTLVGCDSGCASRLPRFVDNADGTIDDKLTGLQWEKQTALGGQANIISQEDIDSYRRWAGRCSWTLKYCPPTAAAAPLCEQNVEDGQNGCAQCSGDDGTCDAQTTIWTYAAERNAAHFAGHADWRVPTREELISIVDYRTTIVPMVDTAFHGARCGVACPDVADPACSCTARNYYWSASSVARNPAAAWVVMFIFGEVTTFSKSTNQYSVRLVRGGSRWDRFPWGWTSRVGLAGPTLLPDGRTEPTIPPWTPAGGGQIMKVRCCLSRHECARQTAAECAAAGGIVRGSGECDRYTCASIY